MYLIYDTETTGLVNHKLGPIPAQPGIVKFGAILFSEKREELSTINLLVKPRCFITTKALETHRISQSAADCHGVSEIMAVSIWDRLAEKASHMVAHNETFDWTVMEAARLLYRIERRGAHENKRFCTKLATTPILKIPPTAKMVKYGHGDKFKAPSLTECHEKFFGEGFANAHDVMADVRALARVFFHLLDLGIDPSVPQEQET